MKRSISFFSHGELPLWGSSVALITGFFLLFDREAYAILLASWIGVTSLIFNAKGHPVGAAADGDIQRDLRHHLVSWALLRRDPHLSGDDLPDGAVCADLVLRHPFAGIGRRSP